MMNAIRHYLFILAGLLLLGFLAGREATLWVAAAVVVSVGANSLAGVAGKAFEGSRFELALILAFTWLSVVLAVGSSVFLFVRYGWLPALGFVVLFLVYFGVREDPVAKASRAVATTRASLCKSVVEWTTGSITEEQLRARSFTELQAGLPEEAYYVPTIYEKLLSADGLSATQHQKFLRLLADYLSQREGVRLGSARIQSGYFHSDLHKTVRSLLGG